MRLTHDDPGETGTVIGVTVWRDFTYDVVWERSGYRDTYHRSALRPFGSAARDARSSEHWEEWRIRTKEGDEFRRRWIHMKDGCSKHTGRIPGIPPSTHFRCRNGRP